MTSEFMKEFPSMVGKHVLIDFKDGELEIDYRDLFKDLLDKQKVRAAIYEICVLDIGEGQGNLDYNGLKLMEKLDLS